MFRNNSNFETRRYEEMEVKNSTFGTVTVVRSYNKRKQDGGKKGSWTRKTWTVRWPYIR